ncbi:MAG: glycosyltransferase [candidate division WOR-3 bacterium]
MKITIITTLPPVIGISYFSIHLINALKEYFDEIEVINYKRFYPPFVKTKTYKTNFQKPKNLIEKVVLDLYNPLNWKNVLNEITNEIVLLEYWNFVQIPAFLYLSKALRNKKVIIELHNVMSHETNIFEKLFLKELLKNVDKIIVHSESALSYLKSFKNVLLNPFGYYKYPRVDKLYARNYLKITSDCFVVLFFGNVRKYKGLDILLRVFSEFSVDKNALLIVAGRFFENPQKYKKYINEKVMIINRFVEDEEIPILFEASDLLVLPYRKFDSQSGVVMLALNYDKPYVISNVGGLLDFKLDESLVFKNEIELFKILNKIYYDGIKQDVFEKINYLKNFYSWESYAKRFVSAL